LGLFESGADPYLLHNEWVVHRLSRMNHDSCKKIRPFKNGGLFLCRTCHHNRSPFDGCECRAFVPWSATMDRQDIIARLRENEAALKARGVAHAALFGSRARGDARPDSDTDS
jgi:hypothetical protein